MSTPVSPGEVHLDSLSEIPEPPQVTADPRTVLGGGGFQAGAVSADAADDDNAITLSNAALGITHAGADLLALIDW